MRSNYLVIKNRINKFKKKINVDGDKSLSIRWVLLASQAIGISKAPGVSRILILNLVFCNFLFAPITKFFDILE